MCIGIYAHKIYRYLHAITWFLLITIKFPTCVGAVSAVTMDLDPRFRQIRLGCSSGTHFKTGPLFFDGGTDLGSEVCFWSFDMPNLGSTAVNVLMLRCTKACTTVGSSCQVFVSDGLLERASNCAIVAVESGAGFARTCVL